jgi:hypothetical protein
MVGDRGVMMPRSEGAQQIRSKRALNARDFSDALPWLASDVESATLDASAVRRQTTARPPCRGAIARPRSCAARLAHRLARTAFAQQCAHGDVNLVLANPAPIQRFMPPPNGIHAIELEAPPARWRFRASTSSAMCSQLRTRLPWNGDQQSAALVVFIAVPAERRSGCRYLLVGFQVDIPLRLGGRSIRSMLVVNRSLTRNGSPISTFGRRLAIDGERAGAPRHKAATTSHYAVKTAMSWTASVAAAPAVAVSARLPLMPCRHLSNPVLDAAAAPARRAAPFVDPPPLPRCAPRYRSHWPGAAVDVDVDVRSSKTAPPMEESYAG